MLISVSRLRSSSATSICRCSGMACKSDHGFNPAIPAAADGAPVNYGKLQGAAADRPVATHETQHMMAGFALYRF